MNELKLFRQAKELCSYVMVITETSPKQFRHTIIGRMHNLSMDIIEQFYLANEVYVDSKNLDFTYQIRRNYQNGALARIKMLAFTAELAMKRRVILPKQFERVAKLTSECQNLLGGWIKSDRSKIVKMN